MKELDQQVIRQLNQNNKELSPVKTTYLNEYGDVIPPNDPTLLKCQQIIEQRVD